MAWWNGNKQKLERSLDTELRYHLDSLIRDKVSAGIPPEEARREALLEFGGPEQLKEDLRDVHRLPFIETAVHHLHFALRMLRKSPTFAASVIFTLALGIGANSGVFSLINAILLRPLPFPESDQLVLIQQYDRTINAPPTFVAPSRLEDWNRLNTTFQAISGYYTDDISETSGELPEKLTEALVAPRFFTVWGIAPFLGRDFNAAEEHFGGPSAIIISYRLWMHHFHGDPNCIGKPLRLERSAQTIVGVMPAAFEFPDRDVDIWLPSAPDGPYAQGRTNTWFRVIGRLKPEVSLAQAQANLTTVQAQLARQYPATDRTLAVQVQSLKTSTIANAGRSLWLLFAAVSLLLLIACTNIAALLLARGAQREREISIRFSIGASRSSIVLQLLTECGLLALGGSLLGILIAGGIASLFRNLAKGVPRRYEITLDWHILLYTLGCAAAATLLCGLMPALQATRRDLNATLAHNSRSQVSARRPFHWWLVSTQVALAVMLLTGAGLMLRTFQELNRVQLGFETNHVLTLRITGSWGETTDYKGLTQRINRTLDAIRALPGVVSAATTASLPGIPAETRAQVKFVESHPNTPPEFSVQSRLISSGYFTTMRIPLVAGEPCSAANDNSAVVINRSFARAYLGTDPPIGRHVTFDPANPNSPPLRIVGVVGDTREQAPNLPPTPTDYWCVSTPFPIPYFLIRTKSDPLAMSNTLRRLIHTLEPNRSVFGLSVLDEHLATNFSEARLRTILLTAFALTAILLAFTGLYGTLSYFVTVRRREVGLRLALGAIRSQIVRSFLARGLLVAALGCMGGLILSLPFSRLLQTMLFGVTPHDSRTLLCVVAVVLLVALVSSLAPALRAASVEPMEVLRDG